MLRNLIRLAVLLLIANALYRFVPVVHPPPSVQGCGRRSGAVLRRIARTVEIIDRVMVLAEKYQIPIEREAVQVTRDKQLPTSTSCTKSQSSGSLPTSGRCRSPSRSRAGTGRRRPAPTRSSEISAARLERAPDAARAAADAAVARGSSSVERLAGRASSVVRRVHGSPRLISTFSRAPRARPRAGARAPRRRRSRRSDCRTWRPWMPLRRPSAHRRITSSGASVGGRQRCLDAGGAARSAFSDRTLGSR